MSWLARVRRLTQNLISHGFGPSGEAPPVVPTTQGCIDASHVVPASMLAFHRPATVVESATDAAAVIESAHLTPASMLAFHRPASVIESRVVAC